MKGHVKQQQTITPRTQTHKQAHRHPLKGNEYLFYTYCRGETQSPPTENRCPLFPSLRRKKQKTTARWKPQSDFTLNASVCKNKHIHNHWQCWARYLHKQSKCCDMSICCTTGLVGRNNYGWMMTKQNLLFTLWALTQELRSLNENL